MPVRLLFIAVLISSAAIAAAQTRTTLDIYVVDVEGGNAVLYVTPSGESVLIDAGNGGAGAVRDAERIVAAARDAGLTKIDHLIITHYHGDHIGGLGELAARIPIMEVIDHGPNTQPNATVDAFLQGPYRELYTKTKHTVVRPGDKLSVGGLDWRVVMSAGEPIKMPLQGRAAANPSCANYRPPNLEQTENDQSVASVITFGRFRTIHPGDLTEDRLFELMCPNNLLGTVDLMISARHGNLNTGLFVHPLQPRAIIVNNGTRKGGLPETMKVYFSSPGVEDVWQIHFSQLSGQEYTVPGMFIANTYDQPPAALPTAPLLDPPQGQEAPPAPAHNGVAHYFKVSARPDGTFTVTNTRNGFGKTYGPAPSN